MSKNLISFTIKAVSVGALEITKSQTKMMFIEPYGVNRAIRSTRQINLPFMALV